MDLFKRNWIRRALSTALTMIMALTLVAPALQAQQYYQGGYYDQYQQGAGRYDGYRNDAYGSGGNWRDWDDRGQASNGQEPGRTMGGSLGLAAGMVGGAALASAVIGAAGIAAWGPLAVMLIGSAITVGGAFAGAKLFSNLGGKFTEALGRDNMWMMIGAAAGAVAAIALIPAAGPFAGAAGLIVKGLIGGLAGGVLGKLFAPQLESIAQPRYLMLGMGALLGGLGGGIPGAIAGAVGGYALGAILDDHFFSQPGDSVSNYLPFGDGGIRGIGDTLGNAWDRLTNWGQNRVDDTKDFWDRNYNRDDYYDPVYRQSYSNARGRNFGYDQPYDYGYQYDGYYAYAPQASNFGDAAGSLRAEYTRLKDIISSGRATQADYQRYRQVDQQYRQLSGQ